MENFKDDMFETVIANEPVSVIQFSATWCGPCKSLRPRMEKLSGDRNRCTQLRFLMWNSWRSHSNCI